MSSLTPFLSGVDADVFVSYAHDDDRQTAWVAKFVEHLNHETNLALGRFLQRRVGTCFFRDSLDSRFVRGDLGDTLEIAVRRSGFLLVIMSEQYLQSKWCVKEGELFLQRWGDEAPSRIYIACKERTTLDWPAFLLASNGERLQFNRFYTESSGRWETIEVVTSDKVRDPRINPKLQPMAYQLATDLWESSRRPVAGEANPSKGRVFLAMTTESLDQEVREELRTELGRRNIEVLPDPDPIDAASLEQALDSQLRQCDLFAQLIDTARPRFPPEAPLGFISVQDAAAKDAKIERMRWLDTSVDVARMRGDYPAFLSDAGVSLNRGTVPEFAQAIETRLAQQSRRPARAKSGGTRLIGLASDESIDFSLDELKGVVRSAVDDKRIIFVGDPKPGDDDIDLEDIVCGSHAVLLLWGNTTAQWVGPTIRDFVLDSSLRMENDKHRCGLVYLPPPTKKSLGYDPAEILYVVDCRAGLDSVKFKHVFEDIL
ncbi:MAG: TIR domain-containing protein [Gammaproteobacteria bacterium]|nr:TIR domain-containing protein [Gammaproteobacteria bacterium]